MGEIEIIPFLCMLIALNLISLTSSILIEAESALLTNSIYALKSYGSFP